MELKDYLNLARKWWWLVLVACIAGAGTAAVWSKMQPKIYRAQVTLKANPNRADYGLDLFLRSRLNSYKADLTSRALAQQVIDRAQVDELPDTLVGNIKVRPLPDDSVIAVTVDSRLPEEAQKLADTLADVFVEQVAGANASLNTGDLRVDMVKVDVPALPTAPDQPRTKINTLAGAVIGFLLGVILAFALEFLDDTIKTPEDIERYTALSTLGSIPMSRDSRRLRRKAGQPAGMAAVPRPRENKG